MPFAKVVRPLFRAPQRYPNGVTNVTRGNYNDKLGVPDYTQWVVDHCDFVSGDLASKWAAVLVVGTGTAAQLAGDGGLVTIVNSAAGSDKTSLVKTASTGQNWTLQGPGALQNRMFWFEAAVNVDDATNAHFGAGLAATATDFNTYADGVMIRKPAAGTGFVFEVKKTGQPTTTLTIPTSVVCPANTLIKLGFFYKGAVPQAFAQIGGGGASFSEFVAMIDLNDGNGQRQFSTLVPNTSIPTAALMPTVGVLNGTAAARTLNVDYVTVAKERFFA